MIKISVIKMAIKTAVCGGVLQWVAVCGGVLQFVVVCVDDTHIYNTDGNEDSCVLPCVAVCSCVLQYVAVHI